MDDSYSRFSRVVESYARYRPHYPQQLVALLEAECDLTAGQVVADIGSGTGLLTELFLKNGNRVYGVEPNPEMRSAAEQLLQSYPSFTSVAGTAEATTLADHSVHLVTAGQAFHWFKHDAAKQEFNRILRPHGWVVLVWNLPRRDRSAFGSAFEQFWQKYVNPKEKFGEQQRPDYVTQFFGADRIKEENLDNYQVCDFEAVKGRVLSASSAPPPDDPRHAAMLDELAAIFGQHVQGESVTLHYDTRVEYGQLSG